MRYSADHKAKTRERLLQSSGRIAKEKGFANTGVDGFMEAVDLTGGAFYSHFPSKSAFFEAVIEQEFSMSVARIAGDPNQPLEKWLSNLLDRYLSQYHVEHPGEGCALPCLTNEIARSDESAKTAYEKAMTEIKDCLADRLGDEETAWATIAQCVGALIIARAMASEDGSRTVLESSKTFLKKAISESLGSEQAPTRRARPKSKSQMG